MQPIHVLLAVFVVIAAALDLRSRRIPNWLNIGAAISGLAASTLAGGVPGSLDSLMGIGTGLLLLLPFFAIRVLGAGDVKMLAAIGSFVGPTGVFLCGLYGMIAGGVLALLALIPGRRGQVARENIRTMFMSAALRIGGGAGPEVRLESNTAARLPYAVALAAGTIAWMFLQERSS